MLRRNVLRAVIASCCAAIMTGAGRCEPVDFARDIQPVLAKRCYACHGPDAQEGGVRLDDAAAATRELDSGTRAIAPGDVVASGMLGRITSADPDTRMPPEGSRLPTAQIDAIRRWIAAGAEYREHWAFRPVERPEPAAASAAVNPIDAFVRDALAHRGLPAPSRADRRTLLRRATFCVTGLPPTEQEMRDFLADESPDAWPKVVHRLLASPHYGEHWARHWLDLVRYADTNSFERDGVKPHAWRYRDYVIRSFNDDKPYDRFIVEQLAGDELPEPTPDDLVATGFYRLGTWDDEPADPLQARYDWLDDIVSTTGQTFLGLTVGCGRCHDHKIDPITQRDYSALLAFVHNVTPMGGRTMATENIERPLFADAEARRRYEAAGADLDARRRDAQLAVTAIEERFRAAWEAGQETTIVGGDLDDLEFRFYRDAWTRLPEFDELKAEDTGFVTGNLFDITAAPSLRPDNFGYVFSGFLKVPAEGDYAFTLDSDDGSRLTVDGRVVLLHDGIHGAGSPKSDTVHLPAGRLPIRLDYFQGLHGRGLTVTWSGPAFAARRLSALPQRTGKGAQAKAGMDLAAVIRLDGARILGADGMQDYDAKKQALQRLAAEELRDAIHVTSGEFNPTMFGPGVYPAIPKGVMAGQSRPGDGWGDSPPSEQARRSIYAHLKRSLVTPILADFDAADTDTTCPVRFVTTQPTQALGMMNGEFLQRQARVFADRVRREVTPQRQAPAPVTDDDTAALVRRALELALVRPATEAEVTRGVALVDRLEDSDGVAPSRAFELYCLMVLNLNEFCYLD